MATVLLPVHRFHFPERPLRASQRDVRTVLQAVDWREAAPFWVLAALDWTEVSRVSRRGTRPSVWARAQESEPLRADLSAQAGRGSPPQLWRAKVRASIAPLGPLSTHAADSCDRDGLLRGRS
jgi:hypothetical protein